MTSGTSTLTKSQIVGQNWPTLIFSDKQLLSICKWCKTKEKYIHWIISSKNLFILIILLLFLKGKSNSTFWHAVLKPYGFPTSKAEERILIGPQLCHDLNNQSAVEFPYNQHLKAACYDSISIWCFVNGWKSDIKMKTIRYQNFILMADSSDLKHGCVFMMSCSPRMLSGLKLK